MTLRRLRRLRERLTPARLLAVSFLCLILAGTLGLKLLPGLYTGDSLSWVDALFTAASAVCVTGLIVVDTASYFTPWGQPFLLLLIQLGGLGILTFTTLAILALGRRLGAEDADAAIVSTGGDITASALTTLLLREMGVGDVFVKVISGEHTRLMEKIGVTETIFPERESGVRLGRRISTQVVLNYVPLGPAFGLQEMAVPPDWVGKNLKELQLRQRRGISVVAVHDLLRDEIEPAPDPQTPLKESDTLLVAGREEDLSGISEPQNLK